MFIAAAERGSVSGFFLGILEWNGRDPCLWLALDGDVSSASLLTGPNPGGSTSCETLNIVTNDQQATRNPATKRRKREKINAGRDRNAEI